MRSHGIILLLACSFILATIPGCITPNVEEESNENEKETEKETTWKGYKFEETVTPNSGAPGKLKEFVAIETYNDNGTCRKFEIHATYLGKENIQITVQKMVMGQGMPTTTLINITKSTYKIKHRIKVLQDDSGDVHPEWAEITVYIPEDKFTSYRHYFWIYSRAEYVDSDGNKGMWSYYMTQEMMEEMNTSKAMYFPYIEGEFYGYDSWVLYGMYGWAWIWFQPFVESYHFTEGTISVGSVGVGTGGYTYTCHKTIKTVGQYTFTAWEVTCSAVSFSDSGTLKGVFSPSLPVPIYFLCGGSTETSYSYYEFELKDITLQ